MDEDQGDDAIGAWNGWVKIQHDLADEGHDRQESQRKLLPVSLRHFQAVRPEALRTDLEFRKCLLLDSSQPTSGASTVGMT